MIVEIRTPILCDPAVFLLPTVAQSNTIVTKTRFVGKTAVARIGVLAVGTGKAGFAFLARNEDAKMQEKDLSTQLDEARVMESHYRALLLLWKKRRQNLENQIPNDSFSEFLNELKARTNDNNHSTD